MTWMMGQVAPSACWQLIAGWEERLVQQVGVLPIGGTSAVSSGSFRAGLAQRRMTSCCSGVVGILPLDLEALRGLNVFTPRVPPHDT